MQNNQGHRHAIGLTRRELIQVGYSGLLGFGLPSLWARAANAPTKAKSVLLIFQTGAPSQIDTLDPKPQAPEEIRGEFRPIDTKAPGVQICEHLPGLAARADKFAIVRSMTHGLPSHEHATMMATATSKITFLVNGRFILFIGFCPRLDESNTRHKWRAILI